MYLNFFILYNISIIIVFCGKMVVFMQSICIIGIIDFFFLDGFFNIIFVSYNLVKVKFSGFEVSYGFIKVYVVVFIIGEVGYFFVDVLKYMYEDFKKGVLDIYVIYLIRIEEKGCFQSLFEVLKYEIDVGNELIMFGYYNGKLEFLGFYWVCVVGFINIIFYF